MPATKPAAAPIMTTHEQIATLEAATATLRRAISASTSHEAPEPTVLARHAAALAAQSLRVLIELGLDLDPALVEELDDIDFDRAFR